MENAAEPACLLDANGRILFANTPFETLSQKSELIGCAIDVAVQSDASPAILEAAQAVAQNLVAETLEFSVTGEEIRYYSAALTPAPQPDGGINVVMYANDITAHKSANAELQRKHDLLRMTIDNTPGSVFLTDCEGRYLAVNKSYLEKFGSTEEKVLGTVGSAKATKQSRAIAASNRKKVIETRKPLQRYWQHKYADGRLGTSLITKFPVFDDASGEVIAVGTITYDVTEMKEAGEELQKSEQRLQDAIECISDGFALYNADEELVLSNKIYRDMLGVDEATLKPGITFEEIGHFTAQNDLLDMPDAEREAWFKERLIRFRTTQGTREAKRRDGGWILCREGRTSDGGTVSVRTDITALKQREQELGEKNAMIEGMIENMESAITMVDNQSRIVAFNKRFLELLHLPKDSLKTGDTLDMYLRLMKSRHGAQADELFSVARDNIEHTKKLEPHQSDWTLPDDRIIEIRGNPTRDGRFITTYTDVTEARRTQAQLIEASKLATLGKLTATVSHELRNPLGTIKSSFYAIQQMMGDEAAPFQRVIDRIDRNVNRCTSIIFQLLAYTEGRQAHLKPVVIDEWAACFLANSQVPEGVNIRGAFTAGKTASIDAALMAEALTNILQNAWQAALDFHEDPQAVDVELSVFSSNGAIEIHVSDNGAGIPDDMKSSVFEPLFSTKIYGIGLGLPLVKQIIDMHNGKIQVRNAENGPGAVFAITLPTSH